MKLILTDNTLVSASSRNIKPMVVSTPGFTYRLAHFLVYYCSSEEVFCDFLFHILHLCCFLVFGKKSNETPISFCSSIIYVLWITCLYMIAVGLSCSQLRGVDALLLLSDFAIASCRRFIPVVLLCKVNHSFVYFLFYICQCLFAIYGK